MGTKLGLALAPCLSLGLLQGCTDRALDLIGATRVDMSIPRSHPDLGMPDFGGLDFGRVDFAARDFGGADMPHAFPTCDNVKVSVFLSGFDGPDGVAVDGAGNVIVANVGLHQIDKLSPDGGQITLAGNETNGYLDGTGGGNGTTMFSYPHGVAIDPTSGVIIVGDTFNNRIRRVDPGTGATTTLSGNGTASFADGAGSSAAFWGPVGVAVDSSGQVYVADKSNCRIRKVAPDGTTTTLAGNNDVCVTFDNPTGVAVDAAGNVFVADSGSKELRRVAPDGATTTIATTPPFQQPWAVAVDPAGWVYVSDNVGGRILAVKPDGTASVFASSTNGCAARVNSPFGLALSGRTLYVTDPGDGDIKMITLP